jgi:thermostable 8-oxoguanine DNA glycosylase
LIELSLEQKKVIKNNFNKFKEYMGSSEFKKDFRDREDRVAYYQHDLPGKIEEFSEVDVEEIITKLWAARIWGNKLYHAQKILSDNGIEKIQTEFKHLLDTKKPASDRYQRMLKKITGLGPSSITEMLCYIQPDECGIWNRKARDALKILNITDVDPNKYQISAKEYETFNDILKSIANELKLLKVTKPLELEIDLLYVDFFLYTVAQNEKPILDTEDEDFDHNEIRDLTEDIGVMLGFETSKELRIAHGAQVDVVWRTRIGNLGTVTYVFEVHKSGSIDSLLLNLQKAKSNPTVQKLIAISDDKQLNRIEKECEGLPEEFKRDLIFWQVKDVQIVSSHLQSAMEIIDGLSLTSETFNLK